MPVSSLSQKNLDTTFEKNKNNLADALWYGVNFFRTEFSGHYYDSYGEYEGVDPVQLGFGGAGTIDQDDLLERRQEIVRNVMPEKAQLQKPRRVHRGRVQEIPSEAACRPAG